MHLSSQADDTSTSPAVLNVTTGDTATASDDVAYNDLSALADDDESESLSAPVTVSMMNDFSDIETQPGGQNNEEMFVNNLSDIEMPPPPVTKLEESPASLSTTNQLSVPPVVSSPILPVVSSSPIPPVSSGPVPSSIPSLSPSLPKPTSSFPDLSFPTSTHTQPIMTSSLPPPPLSTQSIPPLPSASAHTSGTPIQSLPPSTKSRISPPNMLSSVDDDQPPPSENEEYIVNDLGGNFTPSLIPARPATPESPLHRPTSLGAIPGPGASASGGGPRTLSPSAPTSHSKLSYEMYESGTDTDNPFEPRPKTPPPPSIPPVSSQALASSSELGGLVIILILSHCRLFFCIC